MRRSVSRFTIPVVVALAACSSSSRTPSNGFSSNGDDGGSAGSGDNGIDAAGAATSTGVAKCGATACSASQVCCYGTGGMPSCTASGSCTGSFLACTGQADCSGQTCCFTYGPAGGGTPAGGGASGGGRARRSRQPIRWRWQPLRRWCDGGGFPGAPGGTMSFTAQCQASCGTGSYQLCVSDSECPSGDTCTMGQYTTYCNAMGMGGPANPFGDARVPQPR